MASLKSNRDSLKLSKFVLRAEKATRALLANLKKFKFSEYALSILIKILILLILVLFPFKKKEKAVG